MNDLPYHTLSFLSSPFDMGICYLSLLNQDTHTNHDKTLHCAIYSLSKGRCVSFTMACIFKHPSQPETLMKMCIILSRWGHQLRLPRPGLVERPVCSSRSHGTAGLSRACPGAHALYPACLAPATSSNTWDYPPTRLRPRVTPQTGGWFLTSCQGVGVANPNPQ